MIGWFQFGHHKKKLTEIFIDASNNPQAIGLLFLSAFLKGNKERQQGRYNEQGENRGDGQSAQDDAPKAPVEFATGPGGEHQRQHAEQASGGAHEDWPDARFHRFQHCVHSLKP
jgi:hypothetical protein